MCNQCNYEDLIRHSGLDETPNRLHVLEIVGNSPGPLSAREIADTMNRTRAVNRVTIYRILDLLVHNNLLERLSTGDRSFRYGLAPNANHRHHPHFFCRHCGCMECLNPESLHLDTADLERTYPGWIEKVEVRVDGICKTCLKKERS